MASYDVNPDAVARCRERIDKKQYVRWQRDPKTLKMPAKPETHQY